MDPVCFSIGPLKIHWYGILMATGFLVSLLHWTVLGRRRGYSAQFCSDLLFVIMVGGVAGGRLAYILGDPAYYLANPLEVLRLDRGGLIFYGGAIGGIGAVILFARKRRLAPMRILDFVATAAPLGHVFGRIGCFMNGCCFGRPYDGFGAVTFPAGSPIWLQQQAQRLIPQGADHCLPVHPTQLYESAWNLVVYGALLFAFRRSERTGTVGALYLILYPAGRFAMEFLRGTERIYMGSLSAAQALSLLLMAVGIILLVITRLRPDASGATDNLPAAPPPTS